MNYQAYLAYHKAQGTLSPLLFTRVLFAVVLATVFFPLLWTEMTEQMFLARKATQPRMAEFGAYLLQGVRLLVIGLAWQFAPMWLAILVTITLGWRIMTLVGREQVGQSQ